MKAPAPAIPLIANFEFNPAMLHFLTVHWEALSTSSSTPPAVTLSPTGPGRLLRGYGGVKAQAVQDQQASPRLLQAIADVTAPSGLTVSSLALALPHHWIAQERMVGIG